MSFVHDGWYCAAFSTELQEKPLGRTYLNTPVVLFRKSDGSVAALSGVCPHRFAPLHQGNVRADVIYCPYHGLGFDSAGQCAHNPHGDGVIPPRSTLRRFPVAESEGVVWIWMGEPALADPAKIPDLRLFDARSRVAGCVAIKADYRLVIDNLLDLNHAPYLHADTLSPIGTTRETTWDRGVDSAASHYVMRAVATPASQRLWFEDSIGDYHVSMEWTVPSMLRQSVAMTKIGRPPEEGAMMRAAHLLSPETATTTHYFWIVSRNRLIGDSRVDEKLKAIVENAFLNEDAPMIEACQRNMQGREFSELRPVFLRTDAAPGHARRLLEKLARSDCRSPQVD